MNGSSVEGKEPHADLDRRALVDPDAPFAPPDNGHRNHEKRRVRRHNIKPDTGPAAESRLGIVPAELAATSCGP